MSAPRSTGKRIPLADLTAAQKVAAERFQQLWEAAHSGGLQAIDYSRVRVDSSRSYGDISPRKAKAIKKLVEAQIYLGEDSFRLVVQVLVNHKTFGEVALGRKGLENKTEIGHLRCRFKDALDDFADSLAGAKLNNYLTTLAENISYISNGAS